jgi:hypothetical protein
MAWTEATLLLNETCQVSFMFVRICPKHTITPRFLSTENRMQANNLQVYKGCISTTETLGPTKLVNA